MESPLAICDAQSIDADDFVASDLIYPHRRGETLAIKFNPRHQWFYFPQMQPDEAVLLKCYDSADDGRARMTAHTGFDDPTSPTGCTAAREYRNPRFRFFTRLENPARVAKAVELLRCWKDHSPIAFASEQVSGTYQQNGPNCGHREEAESAACLDSEPGEQPVTDYRPD